MSDLGQYRTGLMAPAVHAFAITPHNTDPLPQMPKAIRANTGGNVVFRALDSTADVTMTLAAGEVLPVIITHIRTTASWPGNSLG
jgi:hypothetical protein